jgi:hypothetical protein
MESPHITKSVIIYKTGKTGMKSHWLEHQGKRILIADYSGFGDDSEAIYAEGQQVIHELMNEPGHAALVIIDVHNTSASIPNSAVFRKILLESSGFVAKRAVIGLTASTRYFVNTLMHMAGKGSIVPVDSLEKALDWIVKEE